jgi:EAL domain-containing protein (putative c-di-GMP-specific phosphodiesterase class I)
LDRLVELGVELSIDDFGTGYSSLNYLKLFPVGKLKIDKSFVDDITTNPLDSAIARAIIHLGHSLGMHVLAEGVETEQQSNLLSDLGCDQIQGLLVSPPLPADDFVHFVAQASGVREPRL